VAKQADSQVWARTVHIGGNTHYIATGVDIVEMPKMQCWLLILFLLFIGDLSGYIAVWTTAMADNSTMAKMARLVVEAQRLIDTCAKFYTPGNLYRGN
jgi:hypothetical protein